MDIAEFLRTDPTFSDFNPQDLEILERALRVDNYPADHVLVKEGRQNSTLYIIMEGEVKVTRLRPGGREIDELGTKKRGDIIGLQSLIDDHPRYSTCRTVSAVTVASLPKTAFRLLFNSNLSLGEHFQFIVARQLVRELRRLDGALVDSIHEGNIGPLHHLA